MALPSTTIPITAGSGVVTAANLINSKYYGAAIEAGVAGHLKNSRPSFLIVIPPAAGTVAAANKVHWDLFNASGSGLTLQVHGVYFNFASDVAVNQGLGIRFDLHRTSAAGTGGTSISTEQTTVTNTIFATDPADIGTLPAQVTARVAPTGGATTQAWIGQGYLTTEEVSTNHNYYVQFQNMVRYEGMDDVRNLTLPEGYGLKLVQGPVAISAPNLGFRIVFTYY